MKNKTSAAGLVFAATCLIAAPVALAQIKPATSGTTSFYEPEQRPHREGLYLPNVPGSPRVGCQGRTRLRRCHR